MHRPSQLAPRSWLRLPARTARLRLTLLYGALFLASGAGLLAFTYALVSRTADGFYFKSGHLQGVQVSLHSRPQRLHLQRSVRLPGSERHAQQQFAQLRRQHAADLHQMLIWSAVALAIMAVLSIALGWYVAGRVLKPLRTITTTARAISARNLGERLALTGPDDEFKALGDTLDDLLTRLQTAFEAQQHFVANASHELRTPLAWEQTLLQVALAEPNASNAALRATCQKVLAASKQQQGLVEALLTLATSEQGLDHHEPIDLAELTNAVLLAPGPQAERDEVEIIAVIESAPSFGHPALIERLIANLIDNAVRYNVPGGHVNVQTATVDGRGRLLVTNTGPQISPTEIDRLFEPFQRLKTTRINGYGGYGLGLSIVQAIASAHHAELTAQPRPDGGLDLEVSFPPASTATPHGPIQRPTTHEPAHQNATTASDHTAPVHQAVGHGG